MKKNLTGLLILFGFVLFISGCGSQGPAESLGATIQTVPVQAVPAEKGSLVESYTTMGTIEAKTMANLSFKTPGRIAKVYVHMGDYVRENQVLVELEKDDYINQNKIARAALASAQVNYKQSRDNMNRTEKLFADGLVAQSQYDAAKAAFEMAESSLQTAQANAEVSDAQLKNTEIRAPFSGYIGFCKVNQGETVNPNVPVMSVVELSRVYVTVNLSDSYIGQVKKNQTVSITSQAYENESFTGKVVQISPAADAITKTFPVRIELDNPAQKFKVGMLAEVNFGFNERKNVVKIPAEAVIDEIGNKIVYVINGSTASRRVVVTGVTDGKMIEIVSGLAEGEMVVVMGQDNLNDGAKVVVK